MSKGELALAALREFALKIDARPFCSELAHYLENNNMSDIKCVLMGLGVRDHHDLRWLDEADYSQYDNCVQQKIRTLLEALSLASSSLVEMEALSLERQAEAVERRQRDRLYMESMEEPNRLAKVKQDADEARRDAWEARQWQAAGADAYANPHQ